MRLLDVRYTVLGAMGVVIIFAIGFAALRSANEPWAGFLSLLCWALLAMALLGIVQERAEARARWLGFFVFAGGYFVLAFGPWFDEEVGEHLITTQMLKYSHMQVTGSPIPLSSENRALLDKHESLLAKLQRARRIASNPSDPAITSLGKQVASIESQIAAIQGFPLPGAASGGATTPPVLTNRWQSLVPGAANYDQFMKVGHCLFTLLAGTIGAVISVQLYCHRVRRLAP